MLTTNINKDYINNSIHIIYKINEKQQQPTHNYSNITTLNK